MARYVARETTKLFKEATAKEVVIELLWGDQVTVLEEGPARTKVRARGRTGFVDNAALGDESLLEVYFIDVGQGDGVLIRTPDGRHIMIDGGYKRASQPTGKNAADFVDWKFARDYDRNQIHLDAMLASHNDADHYGGLADLLNVAFTAELDASDVRVDAFYHAGVSWWVNPANGDRWLGPLTADKKFLTQLLGDRDTVVAGLDSHAIPRLQGEWAQFLRHVSGTRTINGDPTPIERLSDLTGILPGFDGAGGGVAIRVLAPVEVDVAGRPALHAWGTTPGKNTNGNSLLLRLDYGRSRILLTGDLNRGSQRTLLDEYAGRRIEFQCDVAKACHHGSDDVSYEFLSAMRAGATIISSGDNEGHDHPRAAIVAASATTGYLETTDDAITTPLVYSTELARSLALGKPAKVTVNLPAGPLEIAQADLGSVEVEAKVTTPGALNPTRTTRTLDRTYIVAGLIYGLVNVRTNGEKILCATLNEEDHTWQVRTFTSRF